MPNKKILIASDHAGFEMKAAVERILKERGYEYEDMGTSSPESTDYADYAHPLAEKISDGEAERGILLCGTGLGMSYAANRHPHVRAAVVWSPEIAALARQHNDANVLVLPSRFISEKQAADIVDAFLNSKFEGGRHARRVDKIELDESADPAIRQPANPK
jgi:ribose 5-phosphate isomerase B